ncbi:MAG: GWxTD domain-containing protein [Flavobacteriales bacterium]|nr:GWxTD domain-containing protein [Flavobacteriales bacterium]MDW8410607.1 GWxTD domain-containing protein [Flavobacteriales bacterium]
MRHCGLRRVKALKKLGPVLFHLAGVLFLKYSILFAQMEPQALPDVAVFYDSRLQPYVECRLWIPKEFFFYSKKPAFFENSPKAEVLWMFFRDGKLHSYDKFYLSASFGSADSSQALLDVKRYYLPPDTYAVELVLRDVFAVDSQAHITWRDSIRVAAATPGTVQFSHLDFLSDVRKTDSENPSGRYGLLLTPQFHEIFDDNNKILTFYTELYGSATAVGAGEKLLLRCVFREFLTNRMVKGFGLQEIKEAADVIPWLASINLASLPAGHYLLEVEALNRAGTTIARIARYFEHRGSALANWDELLQRPPLEFIEKVNNPDTLIEYIRSLRPIANPVEARVANNVLRSGDYNLMKRFLSSFWENRAPEDPEKAFLEYRSRVTQAQIAFGRCKMRVYDTDRGRVFLQYGPPNHRAERPLEPNTYPYEIWQYYDLPNQKNRIFVFYDYIGGCNTYELLHSTALSERRNDQWQNWLQRGRRPIDIQATQTPAQSYGSMANDLFINPR